MNIRAVADSASQLKRKYLLALRLRPLGPLDWISRCHKLGPWQVCGSVDHQEGGEGRAGAGGWLDSLLSSL